MASLMVSGEADDLASYLALQLAGLKAVRWDGKMVYHLENDWVE